MKNKYIFVLIMLVSLLAGSMGLTTLYVGSSQEEQEEKFSIVTSFYPMYVAALNLVQDVEGVRLTNLSEPQTGCLHDFQLTPADMRLLSKADAFIIHGGGIESFMEDIADSYPTLEVIEASSRIELLKESGSVEELNLEGLSHEEISHGDESEHEEELAHEKGHSHQEHSHMYNAHGWMSISAYRAMVATMAEELAVLDPLHGEEYILNANIYDAKLEKLQEQQMMLRELTEEHNVILLHEAYAYVAEEYGLYVCYEMNLDEERQVSAGEVADVLTAIENEGVTYIFAEELYGKELGDAITKESDAKVLYLDTLNRGKYEKDSYLEGMQQNIDIIKAAFDKDRED